MPTGGVSRVTEDTWASENYNMPCGLYFYYLNDQLPEWNNELSGGILGNCPAIQSVQYVPFLNPLDMDLNSVEYDTVRFGSIDKIRPALSSTPLVYRVKALITNLKGIGKFKCYKPSKSIGGERNWRNESRLYNYPYAFGMLTDNLNTPMEIKYHLCTNNEPNVGVRSTISDRCSYSLFIDNYKGDKDGMLEAMVSGDSHELPSSSSAYGQWFAGNKNQTRQNILNASSDAFMQNAQLQKQLLPSTGSQINLTNPIGSALGMVSTYQDNQFNQQMNNKNVQNNITSVMAQQQDLKSTPNTMISMGSDVYYGLDKGGKKVTFHRFGLTQDYYQRLGDYFAMFGYKQNRVFNSPPTRTRYYYNYIKTVGVNLSSEGVPREALEQIKSIYDNGVTIWHIDRPGVVVGDISKDNYEI